MQPCSRAKTVLCKKTICFQMGLFYEIEQLHISYGRGECFRRLQEVQRNHITWAGTLLGQQLFVNHVLQQGILWTWMTILQTRTLASFYNIVNWRIFCWVVMTDTRKIKMLFSFKVTCQRVIRSQTLSAIDIYWQGTEPVVLVHTHLLKGVLCTFRKTPKTRSHNLAYS